MTFNEWFDLGREKGWIDEALCVTHDGAPVTEEEYENEVCVFAVRLHPEGP